MSNVGSSKQARGPRSPRQRKLWLWLSVPLGLGAGSALALQVPVQSEVPSAAAPSSEITGKQARALDAHAHTTGMRGLLSVKVEPVGSTTSKRGAEQLEYAVDIAPQAGGRAWVKFAYEIATPQGEVVAASSGGPVVTTPGQGRHHRATLKTPARLADGYYQLRIGAAGSNHSGSEARTEKRYFVIEQGRIKTLSFLEWSAHSGANRMHVVESDFQPGTEEEARAHFAAPAPPPTASTDEGGAP